MNFEEYVVFIWLFVMSFCIFGLTFVIWMQGKTIDEQEEVIEKLIDQSRSISKTNAE